MDNTTTTATLYLQRVQSDFAFQWHDIASSIPKLNLYIFVAVLLLGAVSAYNWKFPSGNAAVNAPFIGSTSYLFRRYDFYKNALPLTMEGYSKYGDQMFKMSGNDLLILPGKYVDELRSMPDEKVSAITANVSNFQGKHAKLRILLESTLHTRMIHEKLTPNLEKMVPIIYKELLLALKKEIGSCDDGPVEVHAHDLVSVLLARMTARVFVGYPLSNNEAWIQNVLTYVENLVHTVVILRYLPSILKPIAAFVMPSAWRISNCLRIANKMLGAEVLARRRQQASLDWSEKEKPLDFIQFMMDAATKSEGTPYKLAHRQMIMSFAAIHTTAMGGTQALFDLIVEPGCAEMLREEVDTVFQEDGTFNKASLFKLRKMDSFLRESQRLNPPGALGFRRIVQEDLTLSDGTFLPKNANIMVAVYPLQLETMKDSNPLQFDALRHLKLRQQPGQNHMHLFASTSLENLHFGHGKYACPGRFFAAYTLKLILGCILLSYDIEFTDGCRARPPNEAIHELMFPNTEAKLKFTKRRKLDVN